MDNIKLGSGDNNVTHISNVNYVKQSRPENEEYGNTSAEDYNQTQPEDENEKDGLKEITPQMVDDNEAKLKERIAQCRNIIGSLKMELNEERNKLDKQNKTTQSSVDCVEKCTTSQYVSSSNFLTDDITYKPGMYCDCVDSKLNCDENLIEYEKQLQRYQNTLNMAQIEKKNAIRKQMLAKAYRLKLLEVENQCNIELLRVKQSLQCLEPLKMITNKWRANSDDMYDVNNFELIPRYPELISNQSNGEVNICKDMLDINTEADTVEVTKDN